MDHNTFSRRNFMYSSLTALGGASLMMLPFKGTAYHRVQSESLTVQQVIDLIIKEVPRGILKETVDTIKTGSKDNVVSGIITTMFATIPVIQKAVELNANFIIAHEPTFYNHLDETKWLENDPVFQFKRDLAARHNITIWRFHDYIHSLQPDGVRMGVMKTLEWDKYYNRENPSIVNLPSTSLEQIAGHCKSKLGIKKLRVVGDLKQSCSKIGLLPGAIGGRSQISFLQREQPDVLLCGEIQEWETSEYIRDAMAMGKKQSLVVLGHAVSEEPGMEWLVGWLQPKVSKITVTHVPSGDPFIFV